jgi:methylase of polypeptide subunit release factors
LGCTVDKASADSDEMLIGYIRSVEQADNEYTKADRFRDFIRKLFPDIGVGSLGGFYPELEKYVKYSGRGSFIAGKPDSLFGSLIIEFENVLDDRRRKEAEEQLRRYIAALWSIQASRGQKRGRFTALASDGLKFVVYKPRTVVQAGPVAVEQVVLEPVDQMDITEHPASEVNDWLKRYIVLGASELAHVDPDEFAKKFGVGVSVYKKVMQLLSKGWGKVKSAFSTLYEQWDTHLRIVYGTQVASEDLYLKHTYLATLAKLVVFSSYSGGSLPLSRREVVEILNGEVFRRWGIVNFIEEDLFSWVHKVDEGVEAAQFLIKELANYDLSSVTIDVFKELYQSLVDPEARHDLGEYYTPDWLAEMIVGDVLSDNPYRSVLDPACGSGTFLAMAITYKKRAIRDLPPDQLLEHILESVVGVDIHPLALIISRATYLAAVGRELLDARKGEISVPVYLSDSIRFPREKKTVHGGVKAYSIDAGKRNELVIPTEVAMSPSISDRVVDIVKEYAASNINMNKDGVEDFERYLEARGVKKYLSTDIIQALYYTAKNLANLIKDGRDTIWAFILKNYYKPVFLSYRKFDVIVGNPPWLSYRYVRDLKYQETLKSLIVGEYGLLESRKVELMTHMELATLFFVRSADLYLKRGGVIGFVMPRSVFVSDQHHIFRTGSFTKPKIGVFRLVDLENVSPLFNVPACVVYGMYGGEFDYPVEGMVVEGVLDKKNEDFRKAFSRLNVRQTHFTLRFQGERSFIVEVGKKETVSGGRSYYYEHFRQGATIVPKSAWCVDIEKHPRLGVQPDFPYVKTSEKAIERAKKEYKDVELDGNVEARFLYHVVSGSEIVPFGLTGTYLAVLPIEEGLEGLRITRREEAARKGYNGLAQWLSKVERLWREKRGEKASRMDIYVRLDYQRNLTSQNLRRRFKVLYNTSGTYLVSCVVKNQPITLEGTKISVKGIIADWTTYWMATDDEDEAYYISSVLNASIVDAKIKPMQAKGSFGERHIVKKPLELPIPKFDPKNKTHTRLAELGKECHRKVQQILPALTTKYKSVGKIRSEIKKHLKEELREINELTKHILK